MVQEEARTRAIARLDAYYAEELGCSEELLYTPGVHLVPSRRRTRAGWAGYTKPLLAIARGESLVVSFRPDLEGAVRAELGRGEAPRRGGLLWGSAARSEGGGGEGVAAPWGQFERLRRVSQRAYPYAFVLCGYSMYCDAEHFRPLPGPATRLARDDPRGRELRQRFDGEIFVVFGTRGEIASWAAIKLKTASVWEIAVVTEPAYRGRGLARQVVSAATAHILEQGREALYIYDRANIASGKVCRSLGYREYALEFFSEY